MQTIREAFMGSARWAFLTVAATTVILATCSHEAQAKRVPYALREAQRAANASIYAQQVLETHLRSLDGFCARMGKGTSQDDIEAQAAARITQRTDRRRYDRYRAPTYGYSDGNNYNLETSGSRRLRCKGF